MNTPATENSNWTTRLKKNTLRLGYWTTAWVITLAIAAFGPKFAWDYATLPSILALLVNLAAGLGWIHANKLNLRDLDDLQQKIQLEATALSLSVGVVAGLSYELLEDIHLISFQPEISHLVVLMSLAYAIGVFTGNRRYR
ncbi:MAG: hypothetical protein K9M55_00050 [Candidatus Marinimicrobia bacterium]|nr:hypothetical protein [Candidatus Neomarinimicrobiota bacterium]MCF7921067.1 hypothetical protein [Candidatus Neomarinimicrobiota bacterium]